MRRTIDAVGIAKLVGAKSDSFAHHHRHIDKNFPEPVSGGQNNGRLLWDKAAILVWLKTYKHRHRAAQLYPMLDNEMAQQIIRRGWLRGGKAIAHMWKQQAKVA